MQTASDLMGLMETELAKMLPGRVEVMNCHNEHYGRRVAVWWDRQYMEVEMMDCWKHIYEPAESFEKEGHTGLGAMILMVSLIKADDYPNHKIPPLTSNDSMIGTQGQEFLREMIAKPMQRAAQEASRQQKQENQND